MNSYDEIEVLNRVENVLLHLNHSQLTHLTLINILYNFEQRFRGFKHSCNL
jgi:hypothetical protein